MTISLQTALLPELIDRQRVAEADLAVVIDTLRFTTTAVQALSAGASQLIAVESVADATAARAAAPDRVLLCGERFCKPIEGFDLGNSPSEYSPEAVNGKTLVITTTNGTRAVAAARPAKSVVLAALTNLKAICQRIEQLDDESHVVIFCSGTDGCVALEDVMTAGAIISEVLTSSRTAKVFGDESLVARSVWEADETAAGKSHFVAKIVNRFALARGGANLIAAGYQRDLEAAAQIDQFATVPTWQKPTTESDGPAVFTPHKVL